MESRKFKRYAVQLPVSFSGDAIVGEGTVLNLSDEGCAVITEPEVKAAAYVQLKIGIVEQNSHIHVDLAAVRWSSGTKFGLEFIRLRQEDRERLKNFVKALASTPAI